MILETAFYLKLFLRRNHINYVLNYIKNHPVCNWKTKYHDLTHIKLNHPNFNYLKYIKK